MPKSRDPGAASQKKRTHH
jgi:hypothetical protein